ncbi:MAG: hypothetical protein PSU94_05065 [Lacunisphaera sp.]|nr:hypothetical protein [Lacunisphaera sp.]
MPTQLTADSAKQSLTAHVQSKGAEVFAKYGPQIGWTELNALLQDRTCVRYPCTIEFDAAALKPGEFAYPEANGETPEAGFTIYVHPVYMTQLSLVPYLVLYQLVVVNYGEFASADDAEAFAAAALGLDPELYYSALCQLADQLGTGIDPGMGEMPIQSDSGGCGSGCGCGGH